ncbi:MAG TPA: pitrilysin family protein [Patescibacteria group bacterium]|nr:pitrilysin family protein [Patescibacteria group bacterium]
MKQFRNIIALFVLAATVATAQTDITKRPETIPGKKFAFPKYTETKLKNGLKVFIIEDHEQPTMMLRLQVHAGETQDRKLGTAYMTGLLLTKGADGRSALEIAEAVDGVGASISASASGDITSVSASFLKKHMNLMMDIFSDVIVRPEFPSDEKDKLMPQVIGEIKSQKSNASEVAQAMARKVVYGEKHPYALKKTEESVNSIEMSDIRDFYRNYFLPNNASLAVVGDVTAKEILPVLEKAFANWKAGSVPPTTVPKPTPMPRGVYFVKRPGAVQSATIVTALGVPYGHQDYEAMRLLGSYYGSGFGGRLFKTLRETHSYTYTPFGFITSAKHMNRFVAGAEVRNAVTDSAINVVLKEFSAVTNAEPPVKDLELIKKSEIGEYLLSFEQPEVLAMLLQSADFNGIPVERLKSYPNRLAAMNGSDMRRIAQQYLKPEQLSYIVVGNPDVMESLRQFGPVYEYNLDLVSASGAGLEKVNMNASEIFDRYVQAIGGKSKLNSVRSMVNNAAVEFSFGPQTMKGTSVKKQTSDGKMVMRLDAQMVKQSMWMSGGRGWISQQGSPAMEQQGEELDKLKEEATLFAEARILELGSTGETLGKKNGEIHVKVVSASKEEKTYVFDEGSFLLKRIEGTQDMGQGPAPMTQKFEGYITIDGIQLPKTTIVETPMFTVKMDNSYQLNATIPDDEFNPPPSAGK